MSSRPLHYNCDMMLSRYFSQWERSFLWKLRCHWLKGLRHLQTQHPAIHDDVIKWRHFPRHWPFVRGFHRSPVNSLHKGQWRGALMFSLICVWINGWVNNREAGDLRRYRAHYKVTVMHYFGDTHQKRFWSGRHSEHRRGYPAHPNQALTLCISFYFLRRMQFCKICSEKHEQK